MGHGRPVHWSHYAHIVNGQRGKHYASLDALIAAARAQLGTQAGLVYPLSTSPSEMPANRPLFFAT